MQEQSRCAWQQGYITQLTHQLASLQTEVIQLKGAQATPHVEQALLQTQVCILQRLHLCMDTVQVLNCTWNLFIFPSIGAFITLYMLDCVLRKHQSALCQVPQQQSDSCWACVNSDESVVRPLDFQTWCIVFSLPAHSIWIGWGLLLKIERSADYITNCVESL